MVWDHLNKEGEKSAVKDERDPRCGIDNATCCALLERSSAVCVRSALRSSRSARNLYWFPNFISRQALNRADEISLKYLRICGRWQWWCQEVGTLRLTNGNEGSS
jgi:hypothetical protein